MEQKNIARPDIHEYAPYYQTYISKVNTDDLFEALEKGEAEVITLLKSLPEEKLNYSYAEGKWSIRELMVHLMDVERIFTYRALRFSRNDQTPLAGFDDEPYIAESNAAERSLQSLLDEYHALRKATIEFFRNITPEMSLRKGIANGKEISVRALGFIIPGHESHHLGVIRERYL
jgi:uncharacterized damage-inducible protein DinB